MKAIETTTYKRNELFVLIESESGDAYIDYFINGVHIKDFTGVRPDFKALLFALADQYCKDYNLTKAE